MSKLKIDNRVLSHFYDINGNFNMTINKSALKWTFLEWSNKPYKTTLQFRE